MLQYKYMEDSKWVHSVDWGLAPLFEIKFTSFFYCYTKFIEIADFVDVFTSVQNILSQTSPPQNAHISQQT